VPNLIFWVIIEKVMSPQLLEKGFVLAQGVLLTALLGALWYFLKSQNPDSQFKVRESDLRPPRPGSSTSQNDDLAQARIQPQAEPLRLTGIRLDGAPHEILGVSKNASSDEVRLAYRELMKRYHPDRIGPPGSREWKDAQRIAEKINEAKEYLLRKSGPKS
jgi:hypothetical protein